MKKIIDFFDGVPVTRFLSSILIMAMAVVMTLNVVLRYVFGFSFNWGDEILRYMCVYMAFLGIAASWKFGAHVRVSLFVERVFPAGSRKYFRLLADIITIIYLVFCVYFGVVLIRRIVASGQVSPALHMPMYFLYGIVPLSSILSIIQILIQIFVKKSYLEERE